MEGSKRTALAAAAVLWAALPAAAEPATLVITPPPRAGGAKGTATAEQFCDDLAAALDGHAGVRVIDRQHLAKVLAEHKLGAEGPRPVLAYHAMARVALEPGPAGLQVALRVVDLEMGNPAASAEYPLTGGVVKKDDVAAAAKLCAEAARKTAAAPAPKLKVRLPPPVLPKHRPRLGPFAHRAMRVFEQSLARSAGVRVVHHLEAASAAEESLLILLGLSRLPGERRFAPQADATIEFGLRELSAVGKTFEETVIEVSFRVGGAEPGRWRTVRGKAGQLDRLVQRTWEAAAGELKALDPGAARDFLKEMALRRRQADAELDSFNDWNGHALPRERLRQLAEAAARAAKIDPTFERAAFLKLRSAVRYREAVLRDNPTTDRVASHNRWVLDETMRFLRTYRGSAMHRTTAVTMAFGKLHVLMGRYTPPYDKLPEDPVERARVVAQLKELVERVLDESCTGNCYADWSIWRDIAVLYRQMKEAGAEPGVCREWLAEHLAKAEKRLREARRLRPDRGWSDDYRRAHRPQTYPRHADSWRESLFGLRRCAIEIAIEEGRADEVRRRMADLRREFGDVRVRIYAIRLALDAGRRDEARMLIDDFLRDHPRAPARQDSNRFLAQVERLNSVKLTSAVQRWIQERESPGVRPLAVRWPKPAATGRAVQTPTVHGRFHPIRAGTEWFAILGKIGERLYVLGAHPKATAPHRGPRVWAIDLPGPGRAVGDGAAIPMAQPPKPFRAYDRLAMGGRLYVATGGTGVFAYDPKAGTWKVHGPEEGQPTSAVWGVRALGDHALLCIGGVYAQEDSAWTLDVNTGEVTLLERKNTPGRGRWRVLHTWTQGKKVMALRRDGLTVDVLSPRSQFQAAPLLTPAGWPMPRRYLRVRGWERVAPVKGRLFAAGQPGIWEIGTDGKVLRAWGFGYKLGLPLPFYFPGPHHPHCDIVEPGELTGVEPAWGRPVLVAHDKAHLFVNVVGGLTCYDVEADTWYGPVATSRKKTCYWAHHCLSEPDGLWVSTDEGLLLLSAAEIVAAARKAHLVATSAEVRRRRLAALDAAGGLDAAKFAIGLRRFDKARGFLEKVLKADPDHAEALLLMAMLHDVHMRNEPEAALVYYGRLAELAEPRGRLSGLYGQYVLRGRLKHCAEALRLGKRMLSEFKLSDNLTLAVRHQNGKLAAALKRHHQEKNAQDSHPRKGKDGPDKSK